MCVYVKGRDDGEKMAKCDMVAGGIKRYYTVGNILVEFSTQMFLFNLFFSSLLACLLKVC